MNYPSKVMRATELVKMGWPQQSLRQIYNTPGQKIAWKMNNAVNSPILFDTEELEKYRKAKCTQ
ncbi:hypothetical protein [Butyrivibrio sp.]|uniref:hypothetical protein n=1 Tax=Butyrivibrio sp. TaxID=28121 RepID=UPI001B483C7A|nr:hypothetical protein [Butyrivibrio sp.]MBP3816887.1 hypothetical protein [Butyrivibrio sp.]MBQ9302062.1 hypothetical protein [Butyrivibrio sp.]